MTENTGDAVKASAAQVRVKSLEWSSEPNGEFIAESAVGWYHIGYPAQSWNLTMPSGEVPSFGDDLQAAKAAAQADYERRILAAIFPPVARPDRLADLEAENELLRDLVERAKAIISTGTYPNWHATVHASLSTKEPTHD